MRIIYLNKLIKENNLEYKKTTFKECVICKSNEYEKLLDTSLSVYTLNL